MGNKSGPWSLEGELAPRLWGALKETLKFSDFSVEAPRSQLKFCRLANNTFERNGWVSWMLDESQGQEVR